MLKDLSDIHTQASHIIQKKLKMFHWFPPSEKILLQGLWGSEDCKNEQHVAFLEF